ncbi:hypothetical protein COV18_00680 [Candidatus Woesearchaeota archaeon CG10_big_fil_rev_8_21_14_0_10_37_12]|nr:MAG: hypothetical protein COV18_00680 [Candidatus Woesearchaeota archaeon CG10_big_fil_rev_8_21_14_0_10_37_12]
MREQGFLWFFVLLLVMSVSATATSHYTFEHAEEMRTSGRIEWRDYGSDAFNEAIKKNKPIFLLLTAPSWCYWCHVYTSDDYIYHQDVYPTINEKFIPIYVDADKRQDLTRKYLEGGWPSTTILTPSRERLFGYSGPRPIQNMLVNMKQAVDHVNNNGFATELAYEYKKETPVIPSENQLTNLVNGYSYHTLQVYDSTHGGFGTGQKFPQGKALGFALETYELTENEQFLTLVQNTLQNQYTKVEEIETNYNLFDPVEGGFHRYGTQRDWTPPHYEKMLYDNVKLLKTYSHLLTLDPDNQLAKEVVEKTNTYIQTNWYDEKSGGFYGNTDVHGENEYYGKNPRPAEKPRVEKTKYAEWNAEAIVTYLYLWQETGKYEYKEMAKKSLDFFSQHMVDEFGAYHYYKQDGSKGVQGSLLDNAHLLLVFIEGHDLLEDGEYLQTARKIATYSLENLYDWNSGGFFERNSPDTELYAPGENIDLSKPTEENGVIAYALLKLYTQTGDVSYLNAGIKTLGSKISEAGGLDRGYYIMKAAQFASQSNLVAEYNSKKTNIENIEQKQLQTFWVNNFVNDKVSNQATEFVASEEGLNSFDNSIFLLLFVAFFAGLLSFISPCTLPILPAYIAYTFEASKKNVKGMSLAFFFGLALVFSLLGMSATFVGNFFKTHLTVFSQVAGILLVLFGVYILLGKGFSGLHIKQNKPTTYTSAFLFGGIFGLSWTPCIGPILVAILLLASTASSTLTGGILLFAYAIGLALPLILFSTYLSKLNKTSKLWKIIKGKELYFSLGKRTYTIHTTSLISGLLFITIGYLIFSGTLTVFNQYVGTSTFQKIIFAVEEWLLELVK